MSHKHLGTELYAITAEKAWTLSKLWNRTALIWRIVDHALTATAFFCSILVVFVESIQLENKTIFIIILSSLAALFTMVSYAVNPYEYMSNYRAAFQVLNEALMKNTDLDGRFRDDSSRQEVINAISVGESYIGRTFDYKG